MQSQLVWLYAQGLFGLCTAIQYEESAHPGRLVCIREVCLSLCAKACSETGTQLPGRTRTWAASQKMRGQKESGKPLFKDSCSGKGSVEGEEESRERQWPKRRGTSFPGLAM